MDLDDFARKYLSLGLRINKHINGYVEHYYGPPEIKKKVDLEDKISPKILLKDFDDLYQQLKNQGFEYNRLKFLDKTLIAIETILRKLNGEKRSYLEQVEKNKLKNYLTLYQYYKKMISIMILQPKLKKSIKEMALYPIEFISDEIWAPYIPVYQGERLIVEKFGKEPSPFQFQELIVNQTLPSNLV